MHFRRELFLDALPGASIAVFGGQMSCSAGVELKLEAPAELSRHLRAAGCGWPAHETLPKSRLPQRLDQQYKMKDLKHQATVCPEWSACLPFHKAIPKIEKLKGAVRSGRKKTYFNSILTHTYLLAEPWRPSRNTSKLQWTVNRWTSILFIALMAAGGSR
ncbi:hypothetical protein BU16DRAFT_391571 [Lophium mytilinum]|uniref:Uncharacterized protein n=1 Tax=Lophium mytilinum TaxID=390894 RepID=A0A6A6QSX7_9PEZI|nr:hypothetical protein BU16DRAFT_391571 [Lophium mytilinum]